MRIRQVKPSFWGDAVLAALPEATRLFYIGLWMQADDAGWLRVDVAEIARDLYGYDGRKYRERHVEKMLEELKESGRVIFHECGHGFIPKLTDHQHLASESKRVYTTRNQHMRACAESDPRGPAGTRDSPTGGVMVMEGEGKGNGQVREGKKHALAREERATDILARYGANIPRRAAR